MIPLAGYADRLSVRPGETIKFHVAHLWGGPVSARIVRVISADPNPAGLGIRVEAVAGDGPVAIAEPQQQSQLLGRWLGAYGLVPSIDLLGKIESFTVIANIWPSWPKGDEDRPIWNRDERGNQVLFSWMGGEPFEAFGINFTVDGAGCITAAAFQDGELLPDGPTGSALRERSWQTVACTYDASSLALGVHHSPLNGAGINSDFMTLTRAVARGAAPNFYIGGDPRGEHINGFNGRIERPMIFDRALSPDEISRAARGETLPGLVAAWDFSREMHTNRIIDTGPHGLHGTLHNTPTRAVRGSNWTGREHCFRHAPEQYGAIHFHDDDIDDCRWPVTHTYTAPETLKSGAYALLLKAGDEEENIPFFVVPPKGTAKAKLAVLVSTFTYTVYGNHARPEWTADPQWQAAWRQQAKDWGAYPHNPGDHREYGLSTYNTHSDGSGIAFASWARPMLNLRIGYVTYPYPDIRGSGLRHYPADSHLLSWLEAKGIDYDLITDWELHHEGADLLKRYTCIMSGTHPEYHTTAMLDALEAYRDGGGRFMYLGGNGFYWKIALSPDKPGLIEIRRAEGGIRAWAAEPGEYYNQFDGEYGGLWRRNGRPPQKLVGVGFTAQGNFVGSHYRIAPEARTNSRTAWMFSGIAGDTIGGFGFSGHGAAGFELDRADKKLGTPAHAVIVAQSENHPPEAPWVLVPEEQLTHITTITGDSHRQLIRADMTLFETPNNGAVFSTGSITFCGSLPHNTFDNSISTLLSNVLTRFLDADAKFPAPLH